MRTNECLVQSVMFVPYTRGGELAKKLRENEEKVSKITKNRVKIVEEMANCLEKRGPDNWGIYRTKNALLGHYNRHFTFWKNFGFISRTYNMLKVP